MRASKLVAAQPRDEIGAVEAARILDTTRSWVQKVAIEVPDGTPVPPNRLRGRKAQVGGASAPWLFERQEVERFKAARRPVGRPPAAPAAPASLRRRGERAYRPAAVRNPPRRGRGNTKGGSA